MPKKCFNFELKAECKIMGYVFAENEEEARKMINNNTKLEHIDGEFFTEGAIITADNIVITEDTGIVED